MTADSPAGPPPLFAAALFGERLPQAQAYAAHLAGAGVERGLLGPREASRIWERHLGNSAALAPLVPADARVVDVGSGAGLPGLALAIARPDVEAVLVEPLLRRSTFLQETVQLLALDNVVVRRARAEDLHGHVRAAVVTARAVAPLERLAVWCLPLLKPGGSLLAVKGAKAQEELPGAAPTLRRLGAVNWAVEVVGVDVLAVPTTVIRVEVGQRPTPPARGSRPGRRRR